MLKWLQILAELIGLYLLSEHLRGMERKLRFPLNPLQRRLLIRSIVIGSAAWLLVALVALVQIVAFYAAWSSIAILFPVL